MYAIYNIAKPNLYSMVLLMLLNHINVKILLKMWNQSLQHGTASAHTNIYYIWHLGYLEDTYLMVLQLFFNHLVQWLKFYTENSEEVITCKEMYSPLVHNRPFCISHSIHFRDLCKKKLYYLYIYSDYILQVSEPFFIALCKCYSMCNPVCM